MALFGVKVRTILARNRDIAAIKCYLVKFRSECVVFVSCDDSPRTWRLLHNTNARFREEIEAAIRTIPAFGDYEIYWAFHSAANERRAGWTIASERALKKWLEVRN